MHLMRDCTTWSCSTCRHWRNQVLEGICLKAEGEYGGSMLEWEDQTTAYARNEETHPSPINYRAAHLMTHPTHFCSMYEAREPEPKSVDRRYTLGC